MMEMPTFELSDQEIARNILIDTYPYTFLGQKNIERFVDIWGNYVGIIEEKYKYSIYRYVQILEMRDLLERIEDQISVKGRNELRQILQTVDNRYLDATEKTDNSIRDNGSKNWWWYRIPLKFCESRELQLFPSLEFNYEDSQIINKMIVGKGSFEQKVDAKLSSWVNFVVKIKHDYKLDAYNYSHSLADRKILENLYRELSSSGKREFIIILRPLDEIFITYTIPISDTSSSFLGQFEQHLLWLNRLPRQMTGHLTNQFVELGVFPKTSV